MKKLALFIAFALASAVASAQQINPTQIQPGTNGQVLQTQSGQAVWGHLDAQRIQ